MVSRVLNQILPLEIKPLKLLFMPHTSSAPDSSRDSRLIEVKKSIGAYPPGIKCMDGKPPIKFDDFRSKTSI
jgi:hypothetical protein